jgi:serine/threonine protein kinase
MEEPFNVTKPWPLQILKEVIQQAADGLTFVHHRSCTHKDIKPNSFVVRRGLETGDPKWVCKLTDFGLSKIIANNDESAISVCGTP